MDDAVPDEVRVADCEDDADTEEHVVVMSVVDIVDDAVVETVVFEVPVDDPVGDAEVVAVEIPVAIRAAVEVIECVPDTVALTEPLLAPD